MKTKIGFIVLCSLLFLSKCKNPSNNVIIPTGPVNLTIDLNLPQNAKLKFPGEFLYLEGGIRGVLVIQDFDGNYHAFERTCAFQPSNVCSQIHVDPSALTLRCGTENGTAFENCCASKYTFNGIPAQGPTTAALARYNISRTGNLIRVSN